MHVYKKVIKNRKIINCEFRGQDLWPDSGIKLV